MTQSKSLWESYGKLVIMGLLLLAVGFGTWQYMSQQKAKELLVASKHYDTMLKNFQAKDLEATNKEAEYLIEKHKHSPYAAFAALLQARIEVDQNQLEKAETYLKTAMQLGDKGLAAHVARVRLARVLAAEQKLDQALQLLLDVKDNEGYVPLYEETKGDIYVLQKNIDKAREAYKAAEEALPSNVQIMALQLKLNDLNTLSNNEMANKEVNKKPENAPKADASNSTAVSNKVEEHNNSPKKTEKEGS